MFDLTQALSVNNIIFNFPGYPMSYIEFFGTILNIWSVWLVARNRILTWPVGIIAVVLFTFLFYQIQLYSDMIEQLYFLVTGFWGWWIWAYAKNNKGEETLKIAINSKNSNFIYAGVITISTFALGYFMANIHIYWPTFFPLPASFAYLDTFTTVLSFAATILMIRRKIECWYLWILVDVIGIWLYFTKGVVFISLLYVIFLVLATKGLLNWRKIYAQGSSSR